MHPTEINKMCLIFCTGENEMHSLSENKIICVRYNLKIVLRVWVCKRCVSGSYLEFQIRSSLRIWKPSPPEPKDSKGSPTQAQNLISVHFHI